MKSFLIGLFGLTLFEKSRLPMADNKPSRSLTSRQK